MVSRGEGGKWLPGQSANPAGKPAGATSKITRQFHDTLAKHGFNAAETWLEMIAEAREFLELGTRDEKLEAIKIITDITSKIADRLYPRLKAIEHKTTNPYEGLTPEQKIEMLRSAANALESDVVRTGPGLARDISSDGEPDQSGGSV